MNPPVSGLLMGAAKLYRHSFMFLSSSNHIPVSHLLCTQVCNSIIIQRSLEADILFIYLLRRFADYGGNFTTQA